MALFAGEVFGLLQRVESHLSALWKRACSLLSLCQLRRGGCPNPGVSVHLDSGSFLPLPLLCLVEQISLVLALSPNYAARVPNRYDDRPAINTWSNDRILRPPSLSKEIDIENLSEEGLRPDRIQ